MKEKKGKKNYPLHLYVCIFYFLCVDFVEIIFRVSPTRPIRPIRNLRWLHLFCL